MSGAENSDCRYQEVGKLCEGMRRLSILKLRQKDLAYFPTPAKWRGYGVSLTKMERKSLLQNISMLMIFQVESQSSQEESGRLIRNGITHTPRENIGENRSAGAGLIEKEGKLSPAFLMKSGSFLQKAYMRRITAAGQLAAGVSLTSEGNGLLHRCLRISALIIMTACLPSFRMINAVRRKICRGAFMISKRSAFCLSRSSIASISGWTAG